MDDLPKPLTYEETPVIEPQPSPQSSAVSPQQGEQASPAPAVSAPPPIESGQAPPPAAPVKRRASFLGIIGNLLLFVVLFGIGMWLSTVIRPYLSGPAPTSGPTTAPTRPREPALPTPAPDPYAGWQTYQVISAASRQPAAGVSFKLPPEVLSPICDGTNCASQGTYLPGGTRFTVAARGPGLPLRDFRGRVISDVGGTAFTTEAALVAGRNAVKFTGSFTGRTVAGYAFTRMHGYMVEVTSTLSLEINHFTPAGTVADFEADHTLFEKIVQSLMVEGYPPSAEKGATIPRIPPAGTPAASPTVEPLR